MSPIRSIPGDPFRGPDAAKKAYKHLDDHHGIKRHVASFRLHKLKSMAGLDPGDDVVFGRTGDIYNALTNELLGTLTDRGLGEP